MTKRDWLLVASAKPNASPEIDEAYRDGVRAAVARLRSFKEARHHEAIRGLDGTGGEPDKDGWQTLPLTVVGFRDSFAAAIERELLK